MFPQPTIRNYFVTEQSPPVEIFDIHPSENTPGFYCCFTKEGKKLHIDKNNIEVMFVNPLNGQEIRQPLAMFL